MRREVREKNTGTRDDLACFFQKKTDIAAIGKSVPDPWLELRIRHSKYIV